MKSRILFILEIAATVFLLLLYATVAFIGISLMSIFECFERLWKRP